ncbi:centrosomal protein of 112 kDa-like isoform X2 [Oscarella lobularis]|uniref:centrosomal protein of 112 kDa-like isoform X2 n=1 Tax=Oscarella lobularis TaxID=121494 RepID=UPI0033130ED1
MADFTAMVSDMKPLIKNLRTREEQQRVVSWIRKLREANSDSPSRRENRDMHAKLLLHMLRRGLLEGPFDQDPESGPLRTLPSYMSIYFDDETAVGNSDVIDDEFSVDRRDRRHQDNNLRRRKMSSSTLTSRTISPIIANDDDDDPHHLSSQLSESDVDIELELDLEAELAKLKGRKTERFNDDDLDHSGGSDDVARLLIQQPTSRQRFMSKSPDFHHQRRTRRFATTQITPPRFSSSFKTDSALQTFREERGMMRVQQKEHELKMRMEEARYHEEKSQILSYQEQQMKEILDHKNDEMESMKSKTRQRLEDAELTVETLQRKIAQLERERSLLRDHKDKRQRELKSKFQEKVQDLKNEFDNRLDEVNAEFEGHKLALKQEHTRQMQELLDETNSRLKRMEGEYSAQTMSKDRVIEELEAKCQQCKRETEETLVASNRIAREKIELEMARDSLQTQLDEAKANLADVERQKSQLVEEHQMRWRETKAQEQTRLDQIKREYGQNAKRYADQISDLTHQLSEAKASMQDMQGQHRRLVQRVEDKYRKKIKSLQADWERQENGHAQRRLKLEARLREQEEEIVQVKDTHQLQAERAERALDEFKRQAEKNSSRMFAEMKEQMETIGGDLARSKASREKQAREAAIQLEELKAKHSKQLAELKTGYEQDRERLVNLHQAELASKIKEKEREKGAAVKRAQLVLAEQEAQMKMRTQREAHRVAEMDQELMRLKTEVSQERSRRQSDVLELEARHKEERDSLSRSHEAALSKCRFELEQHHLKMQQEHAEEMEKIIQKTGSRLKQMEKDYGAKADRANKTSTELQSQLHQIKSENQRLLQKLHDSAAESGIQHQRDVQALKEQHHNSLKRLEQEVMSQKSHCRHLEKKVRQLQLENQDKITKLRLQYEEKMKGLLPSSLRNELEGTIASLKSQTLLLQQRNKLLQDELDSRSVHPRYTSTPTSYLSPRQQ